MTDPKPSQRISPPRILSIAGSDSSGGAGIQADIKTITMLGGHAMTAITAVTAQNSRGVMAVEALAADFVVEQVKAVADDIGIDAVKIGMIGSAGTAEALANCLGNMKEIPIVFDPVMVATSGAALADDATVAAFGRLMALSTVTTPNLPELAALGGEAAVMEHGCALLAKGGHSNGQDVEDRLVETGGGETVWNGSRIDTPHTHGTGCTLSSAIATYLGYGFGLVEAVAHARRFVRLALHDAPSFVPSNGPMGHGCVRLDATLPGPMLNQVTLGCSDYAASVAFYRALGLAQIVNSPPHYARFETAGGGTFSIHAEDGKPSAPGGAVIYFECLDLDARCAALQNAGIAFDEVPSDREWGWREARLTDPQGNIICLYFAGEYRRYPPWRMEA